MTDPGTLLKKIARLGASPEAAASPLSDRAFLRLLLLVAASGAVLFHPRYEVGFFNDDASFVLLAQRLWDALRNLSGSGLGALFSHFMPGYPLFLAPFVAAFRPHWSLLPWAMAAVSVLTVYGFWKLLSDWLPAEERRWAALLYALQPLFLLSSGIVMADPFLAFLFVFALLGLRMVLQGEKGGWAYALLCAATAWAVCTKPIGILLAAVLTAAIFSARAWKALRLITLLVWLPCLAVGLSALLKNDAPSDYLHYLLQGLASLARQSLWERGYGLLHSFILVYGLAYPWPRGPLPDLFGAALIAGVIYFCAKGLSALLDKPPAGRSIALSAGLLITGQGLVMSLWTVYSERYALPILPFLFLFLVSGVYAAGRSRPPAARALLLCVALGFLVRAGLLVRETYSPQRPPETRLYTRTLEWIRRETPPESRFLGRGPVIELYTGRSGHGMFGAPDADAFLFELSRFQITHALVTAGTVLSTQGPYRTNQAWQQAMERGWIRHHPLRFRKLYEDPLERTEIYGVEFAAGWNKAVGFYAEALKDLRKSDWPAATAKLRLSLAEVPDFTSALAALASVRLLHGNDAAEGERLLRRALALEPNYARCTKMLVEVLERQGRRREAAQALAAAQAALSVPPFEAVP